MKKIKLAIVYDAIYPYVKGGAQKRNYEVSKRFVHLGYDVHMYGMKWWKGLPVIKKDGVFLHGLCNAQKLYTKTGRRSIWQAVYFGVSCLKLLGERFDVIEVNHMPYFSVFSVKLVCLLKRKKMYVIWNEVWGQNYWMHYLGKRGIIASFVEYLCARLPDTIISISPTTTSKLTGELRVTKQIYTVPMGISFSEIKTIASSTEKSDIIFAGRLLTHKHVDMLIKGVALVKKAYPQLKVIIIGEGPEKEHIIKLITKLSLEKTVKLYNFFSNQRDLYALMKASKIFVSPSTREGFGITVLEANACHLPVITINHKDNASTTLITENVNGSLADLTESSIADKILALLNNDAISETLQAVSEKLSRTYDWNAIAKQYLEIYSL